jgi:hypothetical protein
MGKERQEMNGLCLRGVLRDDGLLDVFIIGKDGIPVARISNPVRTGEEAEILARDWMNQNERQMNVSSETLASSDAG